MACGQLTLHSAGACSILYRKLTKLRHILPHDFSFPFRIPHDRLADDAQGAVLPDFC